MQFLLSSRSISSSVVLAKSTGRSVKQSGLFGILAKFTQKICEAVYPFGAVAKVFLKICEDPLFWRVMCPNEVNRLLPYSICSSTHLCNNWRCENVAP